ncbi:MAG: Isoleucyl-tRNA synthetase [Microgenomates group bacterium GW2011_GWA2_46_7]|nr:MAG: Isoleucyl-tRNA synthetase [Microgenomates group bacterium GW2011_GWA2_46_7]
MTKHQIQAVEATPDFVAMEENLLQHFYEDGIVEKYLHKNDNSDQHFTFFDGPITANNPMGVHHGWGRTYKDLWQKYKNLRGYKQRFQNGFDCQGLWVEVEVEKELGFTNKKQIEEFGVAKFVQLCKDRVIKYSGIQTEQTKRLGNFMDWDHSFYTMSDENNYMIWHFLKVCHNNGWIYKGHDSVPWCPRCQTAISQHEILTEDYKELVHDSVYLTLPLVERENEYFMIWTTTPWTIPANIAIAVDEKLQYSLVNDDKGRAIWIAQDAVERVFIDHPHHTIVKTVLGKELVGLHYTAPFDHLPAVKEVADSHSSTFHSVVATDSFILPITVTEGTGLVHTAVSAGAEDFKLGKLRGLPIIPVIDDEANYLAEGFGEFSGKNAKKHPEIILNFLHQNPQFLFAVEKYKHRYPACWRCKTELVWKVANVWYIAMDKQGGDGRTLRTRMQAVAKQITWLPEFGLERELDWLVNMHDWLISKPNRYWGLALPIYECKCGHFQVIGGKEELQQKAVSGWEKFVGHTPHKPEIDDVKIKCDQCGQMVSRITDVGNVWLDAGVIPFSTLLDPKTKEPSFTLDKHYFNEWYPQFKNWFYSMIAMSTVLTDTPSFKTVLGYGSMLGEDGRAMHKSWGNSIEFNEGAGKIGADIMRWTFVRHNPTQNLLFGYKTTDQVRRQFHLILWNSYRFFANAAADNHWGYVAQTEPSTHVLDRWIISRLNSTLQECEKFLDIFDAYHAVAVIELFVQELSTWYIRRSRNRVREAMDTLYAVLTKLSIILSPFMPYLTHSIYTNLTGDESVHLASWPVAGARDPQLEQQMQQIMQIVEKAHAARKEAGIRLRQPLTSLSTPGVISHDMQEIIKDELNVKSILTGEFALDTNLTPELEAEGTSRDLMRDIQGQRKKLGLSPSDVVAVTLPSWPESWTEEIKQKVGASTLTKGVELKIVKL